MCPRVISRVNIMEITLLNSKIIILQTRKIVWSSTVVVVVYPSFIGKKDENSCSILNNFIKFINHCLMGKIMQNRMYKAVFYVLIFNNKKHEPLIFCMEQKKITSLFPLYTKDYWKPHEMRSNKPENWKNIFW